jgi:hypothetical protein
MPRRRPLPQANVPVLLHLALRAAMFPRPICENHRSVGNNEEKEQDGKGGCYAKETERPSGD